MSFLLFRLFLHFCFILAYLCVMCRRAYLILSMVYGWLDNKKLFAKNIDTAKELMAMMRQKGDELPMVRKVTEDITLPERIYPNEVTLVKTAAATRYIFSVDMSDVLYAWHCGALLKQRFRRAASRPCGVTCSVNSCNADRRRDLFIYFSSAEDQILGRDVCRDECLSYSTSNSLGGILERRTEGLVEERGEE